MDCPKCGAGNPEGERFCSNCGISLAAAPVSAPAAVQSAQRPAAQPKRRLPILPIAVVIIIAVAAGAFFLLSGPAPKGPGGAAPPEQPPVAPPARAEEGPPPLDEYTKEVFTNYTAELVSAMGISGDPFNLNSGEKAKLQGVLDAVKADGPVAVFDGTAYGGLEVANRGDVYYLKPIGYAGDVSLCVELARKKTVSPEELLANIGNETQRQAIMIAYRGLSNGDDNAVITSAIKSYLESQVASGVLSSYEYDSSSDELLLNYTGWDIPWELMPITQAEAMKFIIDSYADPANYSQNALEAYRALLGSDGVLVLDEETGTAPVSRGSLENDLSALLDSSLSKDEKIGSIAGNVRMGSGQAAASSGPTGMAVAAGGQQNYESLLNRPDAIVPPTMKMAYIKGADNLREREVQMRAGEDLFSLSFVKDGQSGGLAAFLQNGYYFTDTKQFLWDQKAIETIDRIFSDPEISILFMHTHGQSSIFSTTLLAEIWNLGSSKFWEDQQGYDEFKANLKKFASRKKELKQKYPGELWYSASAQSLLDKEEKNRLKQYGTRLDDAYKFLITDADRLIGKVSLDTSFVQKHLAKRALFILYACQGGAFKDVINSRVLLATDARFSTNGALFLYSDLAKLTPYLIKGLDPGPVSMDDSTMRNYNILNSFRQGQLDTEDAAVERYTCEARTDTLCSVKLYNQAGQTVSASPHVKSASGDRIEFNAPMAEIVAPDEVVALDASQCTNAPQDALKEKPTWDSSDGFGDKIIKLPWKGTVYRDWKDSDFDGVTPNVPYATITVKHDTALSKRSAIQLTGNPDCCTKGGCAEKAYWTKPDTIKCNGNQPKTDFVLMMPCIRGDYYQACDAQVLPQWLHVKDKGGRQGGFSLPSQIRYLGNCYKMAINPTDAQRRDATEMALENAKEDKSCQSECRKTLDDDCMKHVIGIESESYDLSNGLSLVIDGVKDPSCDMSTVYNPDGTEVTKLCTEATAFGDHTGWIRQTWLGAFGSTYKSEVIYDGEKYAEGEYIGGLSLYKDHVAYIETRNFGKADSVDYVFYDGKNMGAIRMENSRTYTLYGDHIAFENPEGSLVIDGKDQGYGVVSFYGLGDHYLAERGGRWLVDGKEIDTRNIEFPDQFEYITPVLFGANLAYRRDTISYQYNLMVLNGNIVNVPQFVESRKEHFKKKYEECMAARATIEWCEYRWGWGNPNSMEAAVYFNGAAILRGGFSLWGNKLAFVTDSSPCSEPPSSEECDSTSALYYDGKLTELGLSRYNGVGDLTLFGDNLVYVTSSIGKTSSEYSPPSVYLNGAKISESGEVNNLQVFENHVGYRDENENFIYDGVSMGSLATTGGSDFMLYKDQVVISREGDDKYYRYYQYGDKKYVDNDMFSVLKNMGLCKQAYMEDQASNYPGEPITTIQIPSFTPPESGGGGSCSLGVNCGGGAGVR